MTPGWDGLKCPPNRSAHEVSIFPNTLPPKQAPSPVSLSSITLAPTQGPRRQLRKSVSCSVLVCTWNLTYVHTLSLQPEGQKRRTEGTCPKTARDVPNKKNTGCWGRLCVNSQRPPWKGGKSCNRNTWEHVYFGVNHLKDRLCTKTLYTHESQD